MTFQVVATLSNRESLCIGEITSREAEMAGQEDPAFDGYGVYLLAVDNQSPRTAARVLAKFASEEILSLARRP
jgi:hypothetical protein